MVLARAISRRPPNVTITVTKRFSPPDIIEEYLHSRQNEECDRRDKREERINRGVAYTEYRH